MKRIPLLLILGILVGLYSCSTEITGEGNIITQTYLPGSNVTKVSVDDHIDVNIQYGSTKKVVVTGYENLLDYLKISATGGVLRIAMKPDYTYSNMNLTAEVYIPSITDVTANSAGNICIDTFPSSISTLGLHANSSGNIEMLKGNVIGNLTADMISTGSVTTLGKANNQTINISGTGNYFGFNFNSNNVTLHLSAAGNAEILTKISIDATISGTGNVSYKGYPDYITTNITGTGTLIDAN